MEKIEPGDYVEFTDEHAHNSYPAFYPLPGIIGIVVEGRASSRHVRVQWPAGSTSDNDKWVALTSQVRKFGD